MSGRRLSCHSREDRKDSFFFQRLAVAIRPLQLSASAQLVYRRPFGTSIFRLLLFYFYFYAFSIIIIIIFFIYFFFIIIIIITIIIIVVVVVVVVVVIIIISNLSG